MKNIWNVYIKIQQSKFQNFISANFTKTQTQKVVA